MDMNMKGLFLLVSILSLLLSSCEDRDANFIKLDNGSTYNLELSDGRLYQIKSDSESISLVTLVKHKKRSELKSYRSGKFQVSSQLGVDSFSLKNLNTIGQVTWEATCDSANEKIAGPYINYHHNGMVMDLAYVDDLIKGTYVFKCYFDTSGRITYHDGDLLLYTNLEDLDQGKLKLNFQLMPFRYFSYYVKVIELDSVEIVKEFMGSDTLNVQYVLNKRANDIKVEVTATNMLHANDVIRQGYLFNNEREK